MSSNVNEELRFLAWKKGESDVKVKKLKKKHCIPEFKNIYIFLSSIYWKGLENEQCSNNEHA